MANGGPAATDPLVHRAVLVSRYCEAFHCTPPVAEHELERDPDQLGLLIMDLRGYLAAKHAFDSAIDKVGGLKHWNGNPYMTLVETITVDEREAARAKAEADGR